MIYLNKHITHQYHLITQCENYQLISSSKEVALLSNRFPCFSELLNFCTYNNNNSGIPLVAHTHTTHINCEHAHIIELECYPTLLIYT